MNLAGFTCTTKVPPWTDITCVKAWCVSKPKWEKKRKLSSRNRPKTLKHCHQCVLDFSLHKVQSQKHDERGSLDLFVVPLLNIAGSSSDFILFLLGCVVHDSGVVNGIKINDDLRPLGLELPAKNMDWKQNNQHNDYWDAQKKSNSWWGKNES